MGAGDMGHKPMPDFQQTPAMSSIKGRISPRYCLWESMRKYCAIFCVLCLLLFSRHPVRSLSCCPANVSLVCRGFHKSSRSVCNCRPLSVCVGSSYLCQSKTHSNPGDYSWIIKETNAFTPNPCAQALESSKPGLGN